MRRHVLSNPDDLDLDARALARAAARRAGMSVEDWAAAFLSARDGRPGSPLRPERRPGDAPLEELIASLSEAARPKSGRDYETLMAAVRAGNERQTQDQSSRTAIALESMAGWIEQAEARLDEAARSSAEHQDRMASVLSQALLTLKDRLDTVERRVTSERPGPARVEFPVEEAARALAPLSETLVGLRTDVSRLAERLDRPDPSWTPVVEDIRTEIGNLKHGMEALARQEEIAALDVTIRNIAMSLARDLEHGRPTKDLLTLANSVAALYRQVEALSGEVVEGLHGRLAGDIDLIRQKVDGLAETGVERSVIDFLSSQIVDMRQDLAHRAEPQQIERLSCDIALLGRQIADLRAHQVGRSDFASLKTSLENVCTALSRTVAVQEASDVPEQIESLSRRLDILVARPEQVPADLAPIASQLTLLTERMADLSRSRHDRDDRLSEAVDHLSSQIRIVAEREPPAPEPLLERFDRVEQELRQLGEKGDMATIEMALRSIDEKLERVPDPGASFDALEQRIAALAERLAPAPDASLHRAFQEATGHLKSLQDEADGIAERAAKATLKNIRPHLPDTGDLDALKQGFAELKALQTRADKTTQQTLRAVHDAIETLASRFPDRALPAEASPCTGTIGSTGKLPPADRLEAAVRRLHAAALSQVEEVSAPSPEFLLQRPRKTEPEPSRSVAVSPAHREADLGDVRAGFIAAARRAAQAAAPETHGPAASSPPEKDEPAEAVGSGPEEVPLPSPSLMERLRRALTHRAKKGTRFSAANDAPLLKGSIGSSPKVESTFGSDALDSHRRPLLFGLALLILAAGTAQILSGSHSSPPAAAPAKTAQASGTKARPADIPVSPSGFIAVEEPDMFQATRLAAPSQPVSAAAGKFLVDPETVGPLPEGVPAGLREAARSGDAAALYEIASQIAEGRGLAQDLSLAARLYERAAQAGLPPAQERFAMLHEKGAGVARDPKRAAVWYERAAQGGNIRAMHNLATLLASGVHGKPDYAAALRWYGEAAEAGWRDSQFNMGVLLTRGIGTRQDLPRAYKWFSLAASQGDADAAKKRDEVGARLDAPELAAAKAAVARWHARAVDPVANEKIPSVGGQTASLHPIPGSRS